MKLSLEKSSQKSKILLVILLFCALFLLLENFLKDSDYKDRLKEVDKIQKSMNDLILKGNIDSAYNLINSAYSSGKFPSDSFNLCNFKREFDLYKSDSSIEYLIGSFPDSTIRKNKNGSLTYTFQFDTFKYVTSLNPLYVKKFSEKLIDYKKYRKTFLKNQSIQAQYIRDSIENIRELEKTKIVISAQRKAVNNIELAFENVLNDPSSYSFVKYTACLKKGNYLTVTFLFRAKNSFGALGLHSGMAVIDYEGNVINVKEIS